jgi:hypothetical protein
MNDDKWQQITVNSRSLNLDLKIKFHKQPFILLINLRIIKQRIITRNL